MKRRTDTGAGPGGCLPAPTGPFMPPWPRWPRSIDRCVGRVGVSPLSSRYFAQRAASRGQSPPSERAGSWLLRGTALLGERLDHRREVLHLRSGEVGGLERAHRGDEAREVAAAGEQQ